MVCIFIAKSAVRFQVCRWLLASRCTCSARRWPSPRTSRPTTATSPTTCGRSRSTSIWRQISATFASPTPRARSCSPASECACMTYCLMARPSRQTNEVNVVRFHCKPSLGALYWCMFSESSWLLFMFCTSSFSSHFPVSYAHFVVYTSSFTRVLYEFIAILGCAWRFVVH